MPTDARRLALNLLLAVEREQSTLAELLASPEIEQLPGRERGFLHELVFGTLRLRGLVDHALGPLLRRPIETAHPVARAALRLGAHQLLHLRVPARAAVHQSVELTREGQPGAASFVNAVLRELGRRGPPRPPEPEADALGWLKSGGSLPEWLAERWMRALGPEGAVARARAFLREPQTVLRLNPAREEAARRLGEAGVQVSPTDVPGALAAAGGRPADLAREGLLYLQDLGSQMAARLMAEIDAPAGRVLDACAAPGGKTLLLADALAGSTIFASDSSPRRMDSLRQMVARWGAKSVRPVRADAGRPPFATGFARILVDAPCSGLATLAHHPDIRWRVKPEQLARHAERQASLLEALLPLLAEGGALVYSVCSLEPEETTDVALGFLAAHPELEPAPLPDWCARFEHGPFAALLPERHGVDGFFVAALRRRPGAQRLSC